MPLGIPPSGGPLSRTRTRISASSLTKFLRWKRQYFLSNKLGLSSARSISQVLGIAIEDSLCSILMRRPVSICSLEELRDWCYSLAEHEAEQCYHNGKDDWDNTLWKQDGQNWSDVDVAELSRKIKNGLDMFLEEVESCHESGGGPYLEQFRSGKPPFSVPSPAWGEEPLFPIPDKVRNFGMRNWSKDEPMQWQEAGSEVNWIESWEIARPWVKDPRVHQPQRLFHPDGWAAGELDLVLRWDGKTRIVDIKSGNPSSKFAESLKHQLNFYAWLWRETHQKEMVDCIEGWYLDSSSRIQYEVPAEKEMDKLGDMYLQTHRLMLDLGEGPAKLPDEYPEPCNDSAGCFWCKFGDEDSGIEFLNSLEEVTVNLSPPSQKIGEIQSRVNVKGKFTGQWGPLPNHYSEPVLGAMVSVSGTQITIEESEPNAYPSLHDYSDGEVMIIDALPGVWRGNPRLYLDNKSKIISIKSSDNDQSDKYQITRIGLMRTRANVEGVVLSIGLREGVRLDEKPWSMLNLHIWDGEHVAEVVAFGSSITSQMLTIRPGNKLKIVSAELGWRSGLPQLRIDQRSTRVTIID